MQEFEAFDWSSTAFGPREQWPQSMRTTYEIMMSSGIAMCAAFGPDLVFFYNAAYAPFLGKRHPSALGRPFREAWPEVWQDILPLIEEALAGRTVTFEDMPLLMTRNGYEEDTWWTFSYSPLHDESGAIIGFLDVAIEATDKIMSSRRLEVERNLLHESESRFRTLVNASSDVIYRMSGDWQVMEQLRAGDFLAPASSSVRWMDLYLLDEDRPMIQAAIDQAVRTKSTYEVEHRVKRADGSIGWTQSRAVPVLDDAGEIIEWFGMASDVTERRRMDEHLRLVVHELNHRVNNNLAIVQAIAMQTFRDAEELEKVERFTARLIALAQANDLLTGERWTGVDLRGVLDQAVRSHVPSPGQLSLDGPDVQFSAKSALALTLAAHELATNATKYGAWSAPGGIVAIRWWMDGVKRDQRLVLEWRETGGPPVAPPMRRGFGSQLIKRGLRTELNGSVSLDFPLEGVVCRIETPMQAEQGAMA